jgi:hypothetical protein
MLLLFFCYSGNEEKKNARICICFALLCEEKKGGGDFFVVQNLKAISLTCEIRKFRSNPPYLRERGRGRERQVRGTKALTILCLVQL